MSEIRLPNITEMSEAGQLRQIRSYLHQMVGELNFALSAINTVGTATSTVANAKGQPIAVSEAEKNDPVSAFNQIKSLIIKDAAIVNAFYAEISQRLDGVYVAESDFGIYREDTSAVITANSKNIETLFTDTQTITTQVDDIGKVLQADKDGTKIIGSEAWVNVGILGYDSEGFAIYGMEIGQVDSQNGETVSKKFAQYRSDGVHLYDQNGYEVAKISYNMLYITNAEFSGIVKMGAFRIDTSRGFTVKYVGRG